MAERGGFEPPVRTCIRTRGFQPRSIGLSDTSPLTMVTAPSGGVNARAARDGRAVVETPDALR